MTIEEAVARLRAAAEHDRDHWPLERQAVLAVLAVLDGRTKRLEAVVEAAKRFLSLPNWENRIGSWKDVNDAARRLSAALARLDGAEGGATP